MQGPDFSRAVALVLKLATTSSAKCLGECTGERAIEILWIIGDVAIAIYRDAAGGSPVALPAFDVTN
jgi:hypothetical protein